MSEEWTRERLSEELHRFYSPNDLSGSYNETDYKSAGILIMPIIADLRTKLAEAAKELEHSKANKTKLKRRYRLRADMIRDLQADLADSKEREAEVQHTLDAALRISKSKMEHIKTKDKRIASLLEKHRWIPVSERLPKNMNTVLFIENGNNPKQGYYGDGKWHIWVNTWCFSEKITHWKPITLPKEKPNEKEISLPKYS